MAVSKEDALRIYNKFFRGLELKGSRLRKYSFGISGLTQEAVSSLHRDLYVAGSDITRQELLSFIDQRGDDEPIAFLHLPLRYVVIGEIFEVTQKITNQSPYTVIGIKMSSTHYLLWSREWEKDRNGIVTLSADSILGELSPSPLSEGAEVLAVNILPPPRFYRLLDFILLDERYSETLPSSVLPLYSKLVEAHVGHNVNAEWQDILSIASSIGISIYTVFKILEYIVAKY